MTPSEVVHSWVRGHVEAPDDDDDYERRRQGNAWADGYAEVAKKHTRALSGPQSVIGSGVRVEESGRPGEDGMAHPRAGVTAPPKTKERQSGEYWSTKQCPIAEWKTVQIPLESNPKGMAPQPISQPQAQGRGVRRYGGAGLHS